MVLADNDVEYYDDTVNGNWSAWYPLTPCHRLPGGRADPDDQLIFSEEVTKLMEKENWREEGWKPDLSLPTVLELSYENDGRSSHRWVAQLRVRYCTEEL